MKKIIAIILVVFLFSCKNDAEKMDALDFCVEQSERIIKNQNNKLMRQLKMDTMSPYATNSVQKIYFKMASKAFNLYDMFNEKIDKKERLNKISLTDLKIEFIKYTDSLLVISSDFEYFKSEIGIEKFSNLKINNAKTYSLLSTILLNQFLNAIMKLHTYHEVFMNESNMRIVPTKDNFKIGDNLQVFFSAEYFRKRLEFNFTHFTRNRIPLNIKDLNYDKDRRMIDFKIKEKGLYEIKGYEVISMYKDYENVTDTFPFETEYEVK
jgi:hypothetical protein